MSNFIEVAHMEQDERGCEIITCDISLSERVNQPEGSLFQTVVCWPEEYPTVHSVIVVGEYETREAALAGHAEWVAKLAPGAELPESLTDVSSIDALSEGENTVARCHGFDKGTMLLCSLLWINPAALIERQKQATAAFDARNVGQYDERGLEISTVQVPDEYTEGRTVFQTGVAHADYNDGEWIVVGEYETREAAADGHKAWVARFEAGMPDQLTNVNTVKGQGLILASERRTYERNISAAA